MFSFLENKSIYKIRSQKIITDEVKYISLVFSIQRSRSKQKENRKLRGKQALKTWFE